jgi:hypothetical protein
VGLRNDGLLLSILEAPNTMQQAIDTNIYIFIYCGCGIHSQPIAYYTVDSYKKSGPRSS